MKKILFISMLLTLMCAVGRAGNVVTGNGSQGVIDVSTINNQGMISVPAQVGWTLSLSVENPNGVSYNEWGTSILAIGDNAFPEKNNYKGFQLYLQSSTNGGKLNAVFGGGDHVINNVSFSDNFSATVIYDGVRSLTVETTNASGVESSTTYTLTDVLPEITKFAYGLPTGINITKLQIDKWSNDIVYSTQGTNVNNKYHFTSDKIWYSAPCNKMRFTLTETGAFYKGGAKRMSFDHFALYDSKGNEVALKPEYFSGNNTGKNFANMLDGNNGTYCAGTWESGTADDSFEILLPEEIDFGGAFSFSFVTENTTMNAKAFRIEMLYEESSPYTFAIDAPQGEIFSVTYDGVVVDTETTFNEDEFKQELFSATDIPGYTWSIVVDDDAKTITLLYVQAPVVENPKAVVDLANRIGGTGAADKFKFILDPSLNSKNEVFVLGAEDDKILVKGTTLSAITTGLGWYLNNYAKINISWNSLNEKSKDEAYADLSYLPLPSAEEIRTSDAKYRYFFNYCTFGYSMTSWTWKRWQQEIDWMALHGINMPLQIVGLEEVWRRFLTMKDGNGKSKYGYSDEDAKAFVAGPAFTAWWAMNNLQGWGGTASGTKSGGTWAGAGGVQDDAWYARQTKLAKSIVDRQRELGMQPVLPGWSGMIPTNFYTKSGYATRGNGGNWAGDFVRPLLLNVSNANYAEIAADYYACLKEVMGESQYYSMDPFHEGGGAGTMEDYATLYDAMEAAKSGSQWVIQQWQWSATQKYSLDAVPPGRLIVLDLFSDGNPAFDTYNGYAPQEAVFCAIPNFGGRSGLMGRLNNLTDNYFTYKAKYTSIKGIGAAPEAIEQTPVTYDLIFQLPWMGSKPDVKEWVEQYAFARYGADNKVVYEAWELLRQSVLNYGADGIQGPVEDVWAARPNLNANPASAWGKTISNVGNIYTKARRQMLIDATYKLLSQSEILELPAGSIYESNYNYDLVEFGGGVMADYAYELLLGIKAAKEAAGAGFATDATFIVRRDAFLELISDMDVFKGTNLNFRLGKWTQEARDAAAEVESATTATPDWYEFNNARTIVSTWSSPNTNLNDYSYRSWQGLLKDLYLPRWKHYFDNNCTSADYGYFEWNWAHGMVHSVGQTAVSTTRLAEGQPGYSYIREPEGNTVLEAHKLFEKYIIPISMSSGTYYAYRHITNDLSNKITIVTMAGATIDLTTYFGALENVTVSGDFIDGNVTDMSNVAVKADVADGTHNGTITLSDGTVLTFAVVLNPAYYGVYHINYKNGSADAPLFVAYNEDKDNSNNKGYKLIATGTYTADAVADKMFTIVPSGGGYSISAQGKYLKSPTLNGWNHLLFSDNADEAGAYIMEPTSINDVFKIRSTGSGINYINDYDKLVFGNDNATKEALSTFTIAKVASFPLSITAAGMATLCLPFNVILPEGMYAYDFTSNNIDEEDNGVYSCAMQMLAKPGEILGSGTPVVVKADEGEYNLEITLSEKNAKYSLSGSLLCGNFVKQNLSQGTPVKFVFVDGDDGVGFYRMQASGTIAANKCWMEWVLPVEASEVRSFLLRFDSLTGIDDINPENNAKVADSYHIYDINGRHLNNLQKGVNIIGCRKVIIK